jgi:phosphatidylglycerol:prolipoprotein diacylglycerol transferase
MIPTLLELGPIPVRSFGLMVALALIVGSIRLTRSFARYGIDGALAERYVMVAGFTGLLGARVWYIAENWSLLRSDLVGALVNSAGFTFYGGFIIAAISVSIAAYRDGTPFGRLCDSMGPCLSIGYAVGRLGCQLSGDGDYGISTSSWWGMSFSTGVVPTLPGELVYPTPFFESAISLLVLWILSRVEISKSFLCHSFQRFGLYLVLISLERFFVEFLRPNPAFIGSLSEAQVIALTLVTVGAIVVFFPRSTISSPRTA